MKSLQIRFDAKEGNYLIRAGITKASDWDFLEVKEFRNAEELFQYMRKTYHSWIVCFDETCTRYLPEEDDFEEVPVDVQLKIYDYYVE
jgi:hypothetical protein